MSNEPLKVAVVGHTNTGKTSLLRTLSRDVEFGDISNRPATTRHVEAVTLLVDGNPAVELFDTPGLEASSALLEHLDRLRQANNSDWTDAILCFLEDPAMQSGFSQEAKALRQVMGSDVALHVIDARDRVRGKHRDELEILGRCARPILPILNFLADPDARPDLWRDQLARVNMHAVVAFDTVVFDEAGEISLYEKLRTLLDRFAAELDSIIGDAKRRRTELRQASATLVADLLIDSAALALKVPSGEQEQLDAALAELRDTIRMAEQQCVTALLELYRFRPGDYLPASLALADGKWGMDLFSPDSLLEFGVTTGGSAATGALAGLAVDAMAGGVTLGAAAATGAIAGALVGAIGSRGREMLDRVRGFSELHVDDPTLDLLALRQIALIRALLSRGHASQAPIETATTSETTAPAALAGALRKALREARHNPQWSRLTAAGRAKPHGERATAREDVAAVIHDQLIDAAATGD